MLDPVVTRGSLALIGLLTALWFDVNDPHVLGLAAGGVALAAGLLDVRVAVRSGLNGRRALLVRTAGWIALGLALLLFPARSAVALGRVGAVAVLVMTVAATVPLTRRRAGVSPRYTGMTATAGVVTGLVMLAWPVVAGRTLLAVVAVTWIAGAGLQIYARVQDHERAAATTGRAGTTTTTTSGTEGTAETDDTEAAAREPTLPPLLQPTAGRTFLAWLRSREMTVERRIRLEEGLFYRGRTGRDRTARYFSLLTLSVIIATLGVLTDSTAVVVGAMLIAPLMTPIMGVAEALASGHGRTATRAGVLVIGGAALSVTIAAVLTRAVPAFATIEGNSQIASRVNPTTLDLLIALASGVTGAFVLTREDISDSLPGVAIAVALVPPLAVVGVTLQAGEWADALGSLLLFLTNLVAMVLAGGITFVVMGAVPVLRLLGHRDQLRVYGLTVFAGLLILAVPLGVTGREIATSVTSHGSAQAAVEEWLEPHDAELLSFDLQGSTVSALVTGEGDPPPTGTVIADLRDVLGSRARLELRWVPETRQVVEAE